MNFFLGFVKLLHQTFDQSGINLWHANTCASSGNSLIQIYLFLLPFDKFKFDKFQKNPKKTMENFLFHFFVMKSFYLERIEAFKKIKDALGWIVSSHKSICTFSGKMEIN